MKYKVGDVVKVRSDLICDTDYNGIGVVSRMLEFRGKIVNIAETFEDSYHIFGDNRRYFWNDFRIYLWYKCSFFFRKNGFLIFKII